MRQDADEITTQAFAAGKRDDAVHVLRLLADHPALARAAQHGTGITLLQQAARHGQVGLAQRLLQCGAEVDRQNRWGLSALHYAARYGHVDVAALLWEHGAQLDVHAAGGQTPLDWAAVFERPQMVAWLVQRGARVGIFAAAALGLRARAAELLADDPGLVQATNEWNGTPLTVAAMAGQREVVELLLQHGADVHHRDQVGRTPLTVVADEEMRSLLQRYTDGRARR